MDFRFATHTDRESVEWLWDYCFEKRDESFFRWFFREYYRSETVLTGFEQERMMCCLHLIPYTLYLRGRNMSASYIVGLASYPEARGKDAIRGLLQASLEAMRQRGQVVNILMPSRAGFYYPYHWELCYHQHRYVVPLEDLRNISSPGGSFRRIEDNAGAELLQEVYQQFVADQHGYAVRSKQHWCHLMSEHLGEQGYIYILEGAIGPEGYLFYHIKNNHFRVREMAYTNTNARARLLRFIYNHRSQVDTVEWNAPLNDLTYLSLPEPKKEVQLFPFMTGRIVDVLRALEEARYDQELDTTITITVDDPLADWNCGTFSLVVKDGRGTVKMQEGEGEILCPVGALSQLFFGRVSAGELYKEGRLTARTPAGVQVLDRLFPKQDNFVNEYY